MSRDRRKSMIDRDHDQLSLVRQCNLLDVSKWNWLTCSIYFIVWHLGRSNSGEDTTMARLLALETANGKINMHVSGSVGIGTTEPDRNLSVNGIVKISRPGDEDRWTRENWSKGIELENGNSIQFLKGGRGDSRGIAGNLGWLYFTRSPADDGSAAARFGSQR